MYYTRITVTNRGCVTTYTNFVNCSDHNKRNHGGIMRDGEKIHSKDIGIYLKETVRRFGAAQKNRRRNLLRDFGLLVDSSCTWGIAGSRPSSSAFASSSLQCSLLFEACSTTALATASAKVPSSSSEMPEVRNTPDMLMFSTHNISKMPVSLTDSPNQVPTTVHR